MNLYQRINGADWCNIFVVGDLHGCYTLLMNELDKVSFDPARDLLISVGDLVDRGAENVECLDLITMPWFRAVRGNHEQMMLDALVNGGSFGHWMSNGGGWWHQLDSEQDVQLKYLLPKITNLPMIIELVTGNKKVVTFCDTLVPANRDPCTLNITRSNIHTLKPKVSGNAELPFFFLFQSRVFRSLSPQE